MIGPLIKKLILLGPPDIYGAVTAAPGVVRTCPGEKFKVYILIKPHAKNQRVCIFCSIFMFDDTFHFTYNGVLVTGPLAPTYPIVIFIRVCLIIITIWFPVSVHFWFCCNYGSFWVSRGCSSCITSFQYNFQKCQDWPERRLVGSTRASRRKESESCELEHLISVWLGIS